MKAISLFTGAGGLDVGFEKAGFEILWANDMNKNACATYSANRSVNILNGRIEDIWADIRHLPPVDVVFGGPPCQGFSVAGKMNSNDERSRTVFLFLSAVEELQPRAFLMENVSSLARLEKFSLIKKSLLKKAFDIGYDVELLILNAADYGVPQNRNRMFLIGVRNKKVRGRIEALIRQFEAEPPNMRDLLLPLGKAGTDSNPETCRAKVTIATKPVLRRSPYAGMLFNGAGRPLNPDKPSCTLPASMGGNKTPIIDERHVYDREDSWVERYHRHLWGGGEPLGMYDAPPHLRRLTIEECSRIQTFPDGYTFKGSNSSIYEQIGNAVPCRLATAVAKGMRKILDCEDLSDPASYMKEGRERQISLI